MKEQIFFIPFCALLVLQIVAGILLLRRWKRELVQMQLQERKVRDLEQSMELQNRRYTELGQQLEQMRKFRHDMRHREAMLHACVQKGDLEGLKEYLEGYSGLHLDEAMRFCANAAADALAQQYLERAKEAGVEVDAVLEIGEDVGISTPDLCVVLGNCLENAVEAAAKAAEGSRFIRLRALETKGWLSIVMENGCAPGTLQSAGEGYLSSKAEGRIGIGLMSVRAVAEQYGGIASYEMDGEKFRTSVILFKKEAVA